MLDTKHATYPKRLADSGYHTGHWRKSWGPGRLSNWTEAGLGHPAGKKYQSFDAFLEKWDRQQPFCFWLGASDPHRPYRAGSGKQNGMDLDKIELFPHFPDSETVRSDVADYYFEVQRFDNDVEKALNRLEEIGALENTIVVMTGDHGMPFPRCKANLYDSGTRVPMAIQWPSGIKTTNRTINDFVSTTDLAPTFLDLAGVDIPEAMTGKSWRAIIESDRSVRVDKERNFVITGKERHVPCQEGDDTAGTPMRAIRTNDYLLIHNYRPDRWPAGTPNYKEAYIESCWLGDCDNGPTKTYMVDNREKDEEHQRKYDLSFAKRPAFELYDLRRDPAQLNNVADDAKYLGTRKALTETLANALRDSGDPRETGNGAEIDLFEKSKYFGMGPRHPSFKKTTAKNK